MAFATTTDVATRLGRALTDAEEDTAQLIIDLTTDLIEGAVGEDDAWSAALNPVPGVFRALAIERAVRILLNPSGAAQFSETLGEYSRSETRARAEDFGLFLSEYEERLVRAAAGVTTSGSTVVKSIVGNADAVNASLE